MSPNNRNSVPRPFLKWAGGKGQLLDELLHRVEAARPFGRYHEPFVGGGALFFELARSNGLGRKKAFLSDNNERLIEAYAGVCENVDTIIKILRRHGKKHCEEYFYQVRGKVPSDPIRRAARIIYLNKTCFNGLFRENRKGEFNVPFGRYKNPMICDEENLRAVSTALRRARIQHRHFESVVAAAAPGDLVYFDPPYHPVSKTASFTAYDRRGFGEDDQRHLAEVATKLSARGVKVLLSNSMTKLVKELYTAFRIDGVLAKRSVNSRADRRGKVREALVSNF